MHDLKEAKAQSSEDALRSQDALGEDIDYLDHGPCDQRRMVPGDRQQLPPAMGLDLQPPHVTLDGGEHDQQEV